MRNIKNREELFGIYKVHRAIIWKKKETVRRKQKGTVGRCKELIKKVGRYKAEQRETVDRYKENRIKRLVDIWRTEMKGCRYKLNRGERLVEIRRIERHCWKILEEQ